MHRIALLLALPPTLAACGAPCSGPSQIAGVVYTGFSTVRVFGAASDTDEEIGDFPSYESPANGTHTWEFRWGGANTGPLVLVIDGQEFEATGSWDLVDCGTFSVNAPEQTYVDELGHTHDFALDGAFMAYGPRLEGSVYWVEAWERADGSADGLFVAEDLQVRGYDLAATPLP